MSASLRCEIYPICSASTIRARIQHAIRRSFLAVFALFTASVAEAKRGEAAVVPPLKVGEFEIRVPNAIERTGIVEVWNPKSEKKLRDIRVYRVIVWPVMEADV